MHTMPESGQPRGDVVGSLVVRVWREGADPEARVRGELLGRLDVSRDDTEHRTAVGVDAIAGAVQDWLESFAQFAGER